MRGAEGKLLIAGFAGGTIPAYAANRILLKGCDGDRRARRRGRPAATRPCACASSKRCSALAGAGLVRPFVSARFPLARYAEAMRMLQERRAIGRIALEIGAD